MNISLQQQTEQKILKEILRWDLESPFLHSDIINAVKKWQYQLKNLSKEEKPEKIEKIGKPDETFICLALLRSKINEIITFLNSHPNIGGR